MYKILPHTIKLISTLSFFQKIFYLFFLIIIIFFQSCEKNGITITPSGGEYKLSNGIKIIAPAEAVTQKITLEFNIIDKSDEKLIAFYESRDVSIDNFYTGIIAKPDGIVFNKPIEIVMPIEINPGEIPFVNEIDLKTFTLSSLNTKVAINPIEQTISFSLDHFSSFILEQKEEWKKEGERWCRENPCKCNGLWEYKEIHKDESGCGKINDCQYQEITLKAKFYEGPCGNDVIEETLEVWEYSEECEPVLELTADSTTIPTNGKAIITANINICRGLEKQKVLCEVSDLTFGSINPTNLTTDKNGNAITTFKANDKEGIVTITASATVSWYLKNRKINGIWQPDPDPISPPAKTKRVSNSINITITDKWTGTIDYKVSVIDRYNGADIEALYNMDFEFNVSNKEEVLTPTNEVSISGYSVAGTATAKQTVSVTIINEEPYITELGARIENLTIPPILNLNIWGVTNEYLTLFLTLPEDADGEWPDFFNFDVKYITSDGAHSEWEDANTFIFILSIGGPYDLNSIPLKEGTYQSGYQTEDWYTASYTITLKRGN